MGAGLARLLQQVRDIGQPMASEIGLTAQLEGLLEAVTEAEVRHVHAMLCRICLVCCTGMQCVENSRASALRLFVRLYERCLVATDSVGVPAGTDRPT